MQRRRTSPFDVRGVRDRRPQRLHLSGEIAWCLFERGEAFQRDHQRLAFSKLFGGSNFVPIVVPLEELVRGGPEPVPHDFALVVADRADALPFGLQFLHLGGGVVPLRRFRQLFRPLAQSFLAREVLVPLLLLGAQNVAATGEESIARGAEALRQIARRIARHRPGVLPGFLQLLEACGRLAPVDGVTAINGRVVGHFKIRFSPANDRR